MHSNIITNAARYCLSGLAALNRFIAGLAKYLVAIMLVINLSIVFAGVIFRYVLGQPLGWVYEVAIFLMMWSAFVGSAALSHEKAHVSLDFLVKKFAFRLQHLIQMIMGVFMIVFLIIIINSSLTMIQGLMASKSTYLRLPMYWVYSSVPVGMGMVMLQLIELFIKDCISLFNGKAIHKTTM